MSMYNLVHGVNPLAGVLLTALGLEPAKIPRFRDCWWDGNRIVVYTRTGGGNRDYYDSEARCRDHYPDDFKGPVAPTGPWNSDIRSIAGFLYDEDDDFDSTYASFYFSPSPTLKAALSGIPASDASPEQRWQAFFDKLHEGVQDDQTQRVSEAFRPILEDLAKAVK